ncbi:MAG: hypothetical protein JNL32_12850 [Candidatus Kapabacteria bacterium]|nr:hypothetical protein [Candidatus Kapabacteria bacterium]
MDLVTLENGFGNLADETTPEKILVGSSVPHFSALRDGAIAGDITWADFGKEGAALGNNVRGLQCGVFTDRNGNTLIVAVESNPAFKVMRELGLFGNHMQFNIDRQFGTGGKFELNARLYLMETNPFNAARGFIQVGENPERTQHQITYTNVYDLFTKIENSGKKFDKNILFVLSGEPVTLSSVLNAVLDYVILGAKLLAPLIGIPPMAIDAIAPIISALATGEKVSIESVGQVAALLCPSEVRPYIAKATTVYRAAANQDYQTIAREFGLNISDATKFFNNTLTDIAGNSAIGFDQASKTLQNVFNLDTITKFRNTLRSGSAIARIIDDGTIVNTPSVQNWLIAQQAGISSVVPKIGEFCKTVINETEDIQTPEEFRTFFTTAFGLPTHPDSLDTITVRSLVQRAIQTRNTTGSKSFTLPASVPFEKRETYAKEIAKQTGLYVNTNLRRKEFY